MVSKDTVTDGDMNTNLSTPLDFSAKMKQLKEQSVEFYADESTK